jgi:hypothetical protein
VSLLDSCIWDEMRILYRLLGLIKYVIMHPSCDLRQCIQQQFDNYSSSFGREFSRDGRAEDEFSQLKRAVNS